MDLRSEHPSDCVVRWVILFLTAKNETPSVIHRQIVEVLGNIITTVQPVRKWCREFQVGRRDVLDLPREGRPKDSSTSDAVASVRSLLDADRRLTIRQLELYNENGDVQPDIAYDYPANCTN